jgi:hypothetical protein
MIYFAKNQTIQVIMIEHFSVGSTTESLTSRAGLALLSQYIHKTQLLSIANELLPISGSNRGFNPSVFWSTSLSPLSVSPDNNELYDYCGYKMSKDD